MGQNMQNSVSLYACVRSPDWLLINDTPGLEVPVGASGHSVSLYPAWVLNTVHPRS